MGSSKSTVVAIGPIPSHLVVDLARVLLGRLGLKCLVAYGQCKNRESYVADRCLKGRAADWLIAVGMVRRPNGHSSPLAGS